MGTDWTWLGPEIIDSIKETLYMVSVSFLFAVLIGIPLGVILVITRENGILPNRIIFSILNIVINIFRSIPFIILIVAIIPFTRLIVGTAIGTTAAIVPLVIFTAPYIGRLVENSLLEVDQGVIELAQAMGATTWQIIWKFLLPEALGSIILALTIAFIGLVGASAMAGAVGAGGLGDLAITYGYQQFKPLVMLITVVLLVVFVQLIQSLGNVLAKKIRRH
ncbi:methionine ABC transporter permease [Tuberibacillus calidus]|uniref:methionine ABC transporter permease n=1 Tax=Tuberibacillus calidus TaxID=340097 RepID=UPI0004111697|nr:methionine ABC transporter permease [Tuberibacillus calidus]